MLGNPIMTNSAARLVLLARFMHKSRMVSDIIMMSYDVMLFVGIC